MTLVPPSTDETQPVIIPTLSRSKIPRHLSYPIGAEAISQVLVLVPQFSELKLIFFSSKFDVSVRSGRYEQPRYEFIRVEYVNNVKPGEKWSVLSLYGRPPRNRWEIVVQPVQRTLRHRITKYIIESALPMIRGWLMDRAQLIRSGSDLLAFIYDEGLEEFIPRKVSSLEPTRTRRNKSKTGD